MYPRRRDLGSRFPMVEEVLRLQTALILRSPLATQPTHLF
jgi:hypothetical protein